jgi:hypothetical protein
MREGGKVLVARLAAIEGPGAFVPHWGDRTMEFHISREARERLGIETPLFSSSGNVILPDFRASRLLARRINERFDAAVLPERAMRAGALNAMALIDEVLHYVAHLFRARVAPDAFARALADLESGLGEKRCEALLLAFVERFPPLPVYSGRESAERWLCGSSPQGISNRETALEELILLRLANENPAFGSFRFLFDEAVLAKPGSPEAESYKAALPILERCFATLPPFGPDNQDLLTMLRSPAAAAPHSLSGQLDYIRSRWGFLLGDLLLKLLGALDLMREEDKPHFPGPGPTRAYVYTGMEHEYERFSQDRDWMPNVVMIAKSVLVWLWQLSRSYGREIRTIDAIPDEELDTLASRGINALWLIGLWERSPASAEIKRRCGNPEAASSAYSLFDYEIAGEIGGWPALERLREKCAWRGIRLAADMVPNHTGVDSTWIRERPELFMQTDYCPFPGYSFNGGDLSGDGRIGIWIEDHYYDRTDAAVVFKRLDRATGRVSYIYHGNDGTGLPWSDTAQLDFLKKETREAVAERILHVAANFPIIRFDAAMIMARRHFRRLWYPEPGSGGDIPSRAEHALSAEDFDRAMPNEFWREIVDLCAERAPDTLLLAEAFWMMEGYFVRTLGMHRVYNSAFMNMLKREENAKYRETVRNTQEFDKDILKRFVNFMNNPDEETAVAQFGKGDKYFGVCTLMATMPGLPMIGHGQIEGFEEKYGMEYRRAYRDESPDYGLIERHEREIFPLLRRRRLFSGVERFLLYDLVAPDGSVNENVFAYSNGDGAENALVLYNNAYPRAQGRIRESCAYAEKLPGGQKRLARSTLASALGLFGGGERGRFVVMREQRSNLWFIRRSDDIAREGLAVLLDGYQSQVFLDFFEVADDARGIYAAVHDKLGGAGVLDFSAAVQDEALKELYAALAALVSPDLLLWARSLPTGKPTKSAAATLKAARAPALAFYTAVRALLREEAAEEGLPGDPQPRRIRALDPTARAAAYGKALARVDAKASKAAAARFLRSIGNLARLGLGAANLQLRTRARIVLPRELAQAGAAEAVLCYAVIDALAPLCGRPSQFTEAAWAARRLVDRFSFDRKLREALAGAGLPGDAAYKRVATAKVLLPRLGAVPPQDARPLSFLASVDADDELRSMLGVNCYNGITWIVKECFEEASAAAALFGAVCGPAAEEASDEASIQKRAARYTRCANQLVKAAALSEYRLDRLESMYAAKRRMRQER